VWERERERESTHMFIFPFLPPIHTEDCAVYLASSFKYPILLESFVGNSQFEVWELFLINSEVWVVLLLLFQMELMESYECHTCVPGGASAVNLNLHAGGFHLYPHIHGTGGGELLNTPTNYSILSISN